jgi:hypothetical protein
MKEIKSTESIKPIAKVETYGLVQICAIVGASARDKFALNRAYGETIEKKSFWVSALKPYGLDKNLKERL